MRYQLNIIILQYTIIFDEFEIEDVEEVLASHLEIVILVTDLIFFVCFLVYISQNVKNHLIILKVNVIRKTIDIYVRRSVVVSTMNYINCFCFFRDETIRVVSKFVNDSIISVFELRILVVDENNEIRKLS